MNYILEKAAKYPEIIVIDIIASLLLLNLQQRKHMSCQLTENYIKRTLFFCKGFWCI